MTVAGIRHNNPFDISLPRAGYYGGTVVGLPGQPGFAHFPDMASGYAAGAQRVIDYISGNTGYGRLNTLSSLGQIYAEGPQGGSVWAAAVSRSSGIGLNETLDPTDAGQMQRLNRGILQQELGTQTGAQIADQYGGGGGQGQIADGPATNPDGTPVIDGSGQTGTGKNVDIRSVPRPGGAGTGTGGTGTGAGTTGSGGSAAGGGAIPINLQVLGPGTTQPITDWIKTIMSGFGGMAQNMLDKAQLATATYFGGITNWFVRAFLILFAIMLIVVGLTVLMWDHGGSDVASTVVKHAPA